MMSSKLHAKRGGMSHNAFGGHDRLDKCDLQGPSLLGDLLVDVVSNVLEAVAFRLAAAAGVRTATARFERVADRPVFLLRRFDREGAAQRPFLSVMSMLAPRTMRPEATFKSGMRFSGVARPPQMACMNCGGGLSSPF
jgi:hypothetical protein